MSIDLNAMPKLGFGLMRLPEQDGVIDLEQVCRMADAYLDAKYGEKVPCHIPHILEEIEI